MDAASAGESLQKRIRLISELLTELNQAIDSVAERMGFEPMEGSHTLDRFGVGCLKPLSHRSLSVHMAGRIRKGNAIREVFFLYASIFQ